MVFPWFFHVTISHHQGSSHKHVEIPQLMSPGAHGRVTLPAPESCCVVPGVLLFPASHGETGSDASIIDASQLVVQLVACHRLASIMFSSCFMINCDLHVSSWDLHGASSTSCPSTRAHCGTSFESWGTKHCWHRTLVFWWCQPATSLAMLHLGDAVGYGEWWW